MKQRQGSGFSSVTLPLGSTKEVLHHLDALPQDIVYHRNNEQNEQVTVGPLVPSSGLPVAFLMYLRCIIRTPSAVLLPIHAATCCHGSPFPKARYVKRNLPEEAVSMVVMYLSKRLRS